MKQCHACSKQFDDEMPVCPYCASTRAFRIAGTASGAARKVQAAEAWIPSGVRWAGIGLIVLEAPTTLLLPDISGLAFLFLIPWLIMVLGGCLIMTLEWAFWLVDIFAGFQLLMDLKGLMYIAAFDGFGGLFFSTCLHAGILIVCLTLLHQGFSHSKTPKWVRILLSLLAVHLILVFVALATMRQPPNEDDDFHATTVPAKPAQASPAEGGDKDK